MWFNGLLKCDVVFDSSAGENPSLLAAYLCNFSKLAHRCVNRLGHLCSEAVEFGEVVNESAKCLECDGVEAVVESSVSIGILLDFPCQFLLCLVVVVCCHDLCAAVSRCRRWFKWFVVLLYCKGNHFI